MFCAGCGKFIADDSRFCEFCGMEVNQAELKKLKKQNKRETERQLKEMKNQQNMYIQQREAEIQAEMEQNGDDGTQVLTADMLRPQSGDDDGDGGTMILTADMLKPNQQQNQQWAQPDGQPQNQQWAQPENGQPQDMQLQNQNWQLAQPEQPQTDTKKKTGKNKGKKKGNGSLFAIGGILLVLVVVAAVLFFMVNRGRDLQKTFDKYVTAVSEKDDETLYKLIFQKADIEHAKDSLERNNTDIYDMFCPEKTITGITLNDTADIDDDMKADFESLMDENFGFVPAYAELKTASVQVDYRGEDPVTKNVIVYRIDKKWYIMPEIIEKIVAEKQQADIDVAGQIYTAILTSISQKDDYEEMKPYFGALVSLSEDMEYLPQSFQDSFKSNMGSIPDLQYTVSGATGYAFRLDETGNSVSVYISSAVNANEWKVYPDTDASYYAGESRTGGAVATATDAAETADVCRFPKLISKDSPILGYWQSDNAGMYIGYDTTEANEGFSIWMFTSDKWVQMMSTKYTFYASGQQYELTGDTGLLTYVSSTDNVEFRITDDNHITVDFQSDNYSGTDYEGNAYITKYEFTKGNISEDMMDKIGGKWIVDYGTDVGTNMELTYSDDTYHYSESNSSGVINNCVHDKTTDGDGIVTMPTIVMYNGVDGIAFVNPQIGNEGTGDFIGFVYTGFYTYEDDSDKIMYSSGLCGGGGGLDFDMYREGSDRYNALTMIQAYQNFISADYSSGYVYTMGYLDDDDIPEVFVTSDTPNHGDGQWIYTMKNGEVSKLGEYAYGEYGYVTYYEKNSIVLSIYEGFGEYQENYYKLENGALNVWHKLLVENYDSFEDEWICSIDGGEVDVDTYNSYEENLTADIDYSEISIGPGEANSVYEAYEILMN